MKSRLLASVSTKRQTNASENKGKFVNPSEVKSMVAYVTNSEAIIEMSLVIYKGSPL